MQPSSYNLPSSNTTRPPFPIQLPADNPEAADAILSEVAAGIETPSSSSSSSIPAPDIREDFATILEVGRRRREALEAARMARRCDPFCGLCSWRQRRPGRRLGGWTPATQAEAPTPAVMPPVGEPPMDPALPNVRPGGVPVAFPSTGPPPAEPPGTTLEAEWQDPAVVPRETVYEDALSDFLPLRGSWPMLWGFTGSSGTIDSPWRPSSG